MERWTAGCMCRPSCSRRATSGVDTIAQAALASYPDLVRELFGLPPERKVVCGISFGYAEPEHPIHSYRTERAPVANAVTFADG